MTLRPGLAALVILLATTAALAHGDHGTPSLLHAFAGADHLLAALVVGLWAAWISPLDRRALLVVPASFVTLVAAGAAAARAGITLPLVEAGIWASVMLGGLVLLLLARPSIGLASAGVGLFALFHGQAHAIEAPGAEPAAYIAGILAGTVLLHAVGAVLGRALLTHVGAAGIRAAGALIAGIFTVSRVVS